MRAARVAMSVGVALLLLGLATGTSQLSTSVAGVPVSCDPAVDLNRLPFNELGVGPAASQRKADEHVRQERAACRDATMPLRLITWTLLGIGGLVALTAGAAVREGGATAPTASGRSRLSA